MFKIVSELKSQKLEIYTEKFMNDTKVLRNFDLITILLFYSIITNHFLIVILGIAQICF